MICANIDCKIVLKAFEESGGNDLCSGHRIQKILERRKAKLKEKMKYMTEEEKKKLSW